MDASRKKTILITIAASAGFLLLLAVGWLVYFKLQFSVYEDYQYKFSIKYPSSWKVIVHPKENVAVVFLRPKDTALDTLQENFNVTIQPLPKDIRTLDAFSGTIKTQMTAVFGKSISIVQDKSLQWGWREGHEIVIEGNNADHLKMVNAWVLRNTDSCILTFLGVVDKYPQDSLYVNEMIQSFQLQ